MRLYYINKEWIVLFSASTILRLSVAVGAGLFSFSVHFRSSDWRKFYDFKLCNVFCALGFLLSMTSHRLSSPMCACFAFLHLNPLPVRGTDHLRGVVHAKARTVRPVRY